MTSELTSFRSPSRSKQGSVHRRCNCLFYLYFTRIHHEDLSKTRILPWSSSSESCWLQCFAALHLLRCGSHQQPSHCIPSRPFQAPGCPPKLLIPRFRESSHRPCYHPHRAYASRSHQGEPGRWKCGKTQTQGARQFRTWWSSGPILRVHEVELVFVSTIHSYRCKHLNIPMSFGVSADTLSSPRPHSNSEETRWT